jgi:TRAP transporter TAXI family solute receptor
MKLVNADQDEHGIKVNFQSTGGSVHNINAVLAGSMEIGVAQSDRQFQAYNGLRDWADKGPQKQLRAICSVHPESVTIVAAEDTGIKGLADLKGKRVNIGNPGSGHRGNAADVLGTAGLDLDRDIKAESMKAAESPKMLQDGRVDAFFYTVGHPNAAIMEATVGRRPVRIVPITGMESLIEKHPYYAVSTIPVTLYPQATNEEDIQTVGVMTTLITSADVPAEVIYEVTKAIFENIDAFRGMHDAFAGLTPQGMVENGISIPYHPGAKKYFLQAGLLTE